MQHIEIGSPNLGGVYEVHVRGTDVHVGPQPFALVISGPVYHATELIEIELIEMEELDESEEAWGGLGCLFCVAS